MINPAWIEYTTALELEESGTEILLQWQDLTNATLDPQTQSLIGTPTPRSLVVNGLVHYVQAVSQSQVRQFAEIEIGDCLVDLPPEVAVDGLHGLTFTIAGVVWRPKRLGDKLAKSWDMVMRGQRLVRTVLLSR